LRAPRPLLPGFTRNLHNRARRSAWICRTQSSGKKGDPPHNFHKRELQAQRLRAKRGCYDSFGSTTRLPRASSWSPRLCRCSCARRPWFQAVSVIVRVLLPDIIPRRLALPSGRGVPNLPIRYRSTPFLATRSSLRTRFSDDIQPILPCCSGLENMWSLQLGSISP